MQRNRLGLVIAAIALALAAALATTMVVRRGGIEQMEPVAIGGAFSLTSHTGARASDADFRGRLMLVFFGYTFCPDICPTELQVMGAALDRLGARADEVAAIFITVDPERDSPQALADYVVHFHQQLVGLTGTPDEIAAVARAYRVYYAKAGEDGGSDYLMDHTALVYLMGRDGRYLRHFTTGTTAEEMAAAIAQSL